MKTTPAIVTVGVFVGVLAPSSASASEWYASPNGTGTACTQAAPCALATALCDPGPCSYPVMPGDTVWLHGGTYAGIFDSTLTGTKQQPIVVGQVAGERATLDGGTNTSSTLTIDGAYAWYRDFEVTSSSPDRDSTMSGPFPSDVDRGGGISAGMPTSYGIKLINLVIHDTRQGVAAFSAWADTEIYGCLIYYNGWMGSDYGHGHGIYSQNELGTKRFVDNVLWGGFGENIQFYGSSAAFLDDVTVQGNILFDSAIFDTMGGGRNLTLGGGSVAHNPSVIDNVFRRGRHDGGTSDMDLGYSAGCQNAVVTGNYVATSTLFVSCDPTTMTGNTFLRDPTGITLASYPNNTYLGGVNPTGKRVFVRPNAYEPGRATVAVFNWSHADTVDVDLDGVIAMGAEYEVKNAQDFFAAPVVTGTYDGGPISLPMTGLTTAQPVGRPTPESTEPEFNVFILFSHGGTGTGSSSASGSSSGGGNSSGGGGSGGNGGGPGSMPPSHAGDSSCACHVVGDATDSRFSWLLFAASSLALRSIRRRRRG